MRLLTAKETFAQAAARGSSASDAYRQAFGQGRMTNKSINERVSRLLKTVKVESRVAELRAPETLQAEQTLLVDLQRTLFENARIGFSDIRKILRGTGTGNVELMPPDEWDDDTAAAIFSIKVRKLFGEGKHGKGQIGTITEVKLWNKGEALHRLMKHFGAYKRDNNPKKDLLADLPFEKLQPLERFLSARVERRTVALGPPLEAQSDLFERVHTKIQRSKIFAFYPEREPLRQELYRSTRRSSQPASDLEYVSVPEADVQRSIGRCSCGD
jgi:phage terminase small subunit